MRIAHVLQDQLRRSVVPELRQHLHRLPVRSVLAAPLSVSGEPIGAVVFARGQDSPPFSDADEEIAGRIALTLGVLCETARDVEASWALRADLVDELTGLLDSRRGGPQPSPNDIEELLRRNPGAQRNPVAILDADGKFLAVNEAAVAIGGRPAAEYLGRPAASFAGSGDSTIEQTQVGRLRSGELDYLDVHARRIADDGTEVE